MIIAKKYYRLDEAAEVLGNGYKPADLIYLGVHENLPIYVLAADWNVGVCIRGKTDADSDEGDWAPAARPTFVAAFTDRLDGLQRLHTKTLSKFEANPEAIVQSFTLERTDDEGSSKLYEYQFGENLGTIPSSEAAIDVRCLVITAEAVAVLQKQQKAVGEKPLGSLERNTLLKLVIGMAISGYKYDTNSKRNSATKEICDDLDLLGIGLDAGTVKKWLDIGAEMLPQEGDKH